MKIQINRLDEHEDYTLMFYEVKKVRDCMEGEPAIKRERTIYLKHPNAFDTTSDQQVARYNAYIDGAEFDDFPKTTLASMIGQMVSGEMNVDLPEKIAYLEQNADGDGMPLSGLVERIYSNVLQVKFHVLIAEYQGLGDVDINEVTIEDVKRLNPRASIKQYTRENLIDWDFTRKDGKMQLSLLVLAEDGSSRDADRIRTEYRSYLVLGLDENDDYYQQKYVTTTEDVQKEGEKIYPIVNGQRLKWIPAEIIMDEEWSAGSLPRALGYLYPVCSAALARYRVSADYKEALRQMQPTTFTTGWKEDGMDVFEKLNERRYIAFGAGIANNMPEGVEVDIQSMGIAAEPFERYFEANENKARALGARLNGLQGNRSDVSATEVAVDDRNSNAVMMSIAKNTEAGIRRILSYCAMYEGLWGEDAVETNLDQIIVDLPKEFGKVDMQPDEVNAISGAVSSGLISKKEGIRKLVAGGFTVSDAETIMDELEQQGPAIGELPRPAPNGQDAVASDDE